ncbi:helix-hairpin-helix domain-containing protein [bacterium]|nr:helix-hairpin-helix domain-containing protein [bacterium]
MKTNFTKVIFIISALFPMILGCPRLIAEEIALVNINTASQEELEGLPEINHQIASRIIEYREKYQGFQSKEEIMEIKGIGPKLFQKIAALITISDPLPNPQIPIKLNINKASPEDFQKYLNLNVELVKNIIAWRENNQCFQDIRQLMEVEGMDEETFQSIEGQITIGENVKGSTTVTGEAIKLMPAPLIGQVQLIDLNIATKEELETLPGINSTNANRIIEYRKEHGNFQNIEQIKEVKGISESIFEKIHDKVTVSNPPK